MYYNNVYLICNVYLLYYIYTYIYIKHKHCFLNCPRDWTIKFSQGPL